MKRYLWFIVMALVIASMLLAGCGGNETTTPATTAPTTAPTTAATTTPAAAMPKSGGTLRFITNNLPMASIGIPERMQNLSIMYTQPMIEPLVQVPPSGEIIPLLAESVKLSDDKLTVTINLRHGVKFHDGSDFNSDVVMWNFERSIAAKSAGTERIVSYEATDDYTVKVVLDKYENTWVGNLMGNLGYMESKVAIEKYGDEYIDWHPVGTGPFKFGEYQDENYLLMNRYDDYWGGKPYLDAIKYVFIADPVTAQIAFESGEGEVITLSANAAKAAVDLKAKGFVVTAAYGGLSNCFVPSVSNPDSPLSNLKVREAIEYAIDKDAIAKNLGGDYYFGLYQYSSPVSSSWIKDFEGRRYNVAKAKELLKEAGYENGFKTTLYSPSHIAGDEMQAVQSYLKAVGIEANIELVSIAKWIEMETNGWEEGLLQSPTYLSNTWGLSIKRFLITPAEPNWAEGIYWDSLYRPAELEKACQEYLVLSDPVAQAAKAKEIVQILFDNCSFIPLFDTMGITIMTTAVKDFTKGMALGAAPRGWAFERCWLDQ